MFLLHKLQETFFCLLIVMTLLESHTRTGFASYLFEFDKACTLVDGICQHLIHLGDVSATMLSLVRFSQCLWFGLDFCFMTRGSPELLIIPSRTFIFNDSNINPHPNDTSPFAEPPMSLLVKTISKNPDFAKNSSSKQGLSRSSRAASDKSMLQQRHKLRCLSAVIKII